MTPMALRGARIHVSWQAVVAFVVVLLFAAVVFAVRVVRAEQTSTSRPVGAATPAGVVGRSVPSAFATTGVTRPAAPAPSESVAAGGGGSGGGGSGSGSGGGSSTGLATIVVHVVGQVAKPGVVTVVSGARVVDAITLAGGPLPGADVQQVNLARTLVDGEQVSVPKPGETIPAAGSAGSAGSVGSVGAGGARAGASAGGAGALIDLNGADVATLDGLPGVGPVLAQRIVDWRTEHKRFTTVDELGEVSGIGDKLLSQIRPKVRV